MHRRSIVLVTAGFALAFAAFASATGNRSDAATVKVRLFEFRVVPAVTNVAAGRVTFVVTNTGKIKHEFVVIKTRKRAAKLLKGKEADETGAVGEIGGLRPGQTRRVTLTLTAGHYALICNLPGHYLAGQRADFTAR
jgi:uncharacterized cupredoxin-like copper-binding protein